MHERSKKFESRSWGNWNEINDHNNNSWEIPSISLSGVALWRKIPYRLSRELELLSDAVLQHHPTHLTSFHEKGKHHPRDDIWVSWAQIYNRGRIQIHSNSAWTLNCARSTTSRAVFSPLLSLRFPNQQSFTHHWLHPTLSPHLVRLNEKSKRILIEFRIHLYH